MHRFAQHVLQAHGLGGKLNVITSGNVCSLIAAAVLVLNWVGHPTGQKLYYVCLTYQAQIVLPQWHSPLNAYPLGSFNARLVYFGVHCLASQRVHVFVKHLLKVNQSALARTVLPVLEG
jgi:hypothetical protein